jgi:hypothetical protein
MAWTKKELTDWLIKDLGVTEEVATTLLPNLEAVAPKIEAGLLRQSDYSRSMNELKDLQASHKKASDDLNAEIAAWANLSAEQKANNPELQNRLHAAQADVLRLTQVVESVASQAGLDPKAILEGAKITIPKKEDEAPKVDLTGYVKAEDIQATVGGLTNMILRLGPQLMKIAHEHQQLTGEFLDTEAVTAEILTRANTKGNSKSLDARAVWEELHAIPAKREAKAKEQYDADIAAAVERGRTEAMSQQIPGAQLPQGRHSIVFTKPDGTPRTSVLERAAPQSTALAAATALRSGRYRQASGPGGPKPAATAT